MIDILASDLKSLVTERIYKSGGYTNPHAHLDRAYTITPETLPLADAPLQEKWDLVNKIKRESSITAIYDRMCKATEMMLKQGVSAIGSFIDVDPIVRDKSIKAAQRLRDTFRGVDIVFANQTLQGVINAEAYEWFRVGAGFVDIIGGLPKKDGKDAACHLDIVLGTARELGKMAHVHVDQFNDPNEDETFLLAEKTIEHSMQGRVVAVHSVSVAAHVKEERNCIYNKMLEARLMLITCPTAWIDSRRSEQLSVSHNSIAPIEEMVPLGIPIGVGTDNIADIYKPFTDGDMWTEVRFLLESCHFYDMDKLVEIATMNGRKVLGLPPLNS